MSAELRRRRLRPWAEAARLVLGAQEALPIATIFERIQERGLRDTTPGSKECLFSMMRAHSRGPHSMFYRRLLVPADGQGAATICFGLRSDLPPATTIVETDADTDDESRHDSRFKPKVQLLKVDQHEQHNNNNGNSNSLANGAGGDTASEGTPATTESEAENVAPDDIVSQQLPQMKRKASGQEDTPPPKRCLRPKPQRNSDEKGTVIADEHTGVSTPERMNSPFAGSSGSGGASEDPSVQQQQQQQQEQQQQPPAPSVTAGAGTACSAVVGDPQVLATATETLSTPLPANSNPLTRSSSSGSTLSGRGSTRSTPLAGTGFRTIREMLNNLSDQYGIRLNRRPGKKMTMSQQLEESKRGFVDLETPDSILVNVNVKELLSAYAFSLLPRAQQRQLLSLLPPVELTRRKQEQSAGVGSSLAGSIPGDADVEVNVESALNNEFFASACQEWRERLTYGDLTPESQLKQKAEFEKHLRSVDGWKRRNFEIVWGTSAASRAESAIEEREHLYRIRREHEQNLAEQETLRLEALEAKRRSEELAQEAAVTAAAVAAELLRKEVKANSELKAAVSPVIKVERLPVTESAPLPPPPSVAASSNPCTKSSVATAAVATAVVKPEVETEEELLAKEEARIATLLPNYSESLHEVLAEHGVPVSANHRRKCNNLVPPSLCLAARRVGLRLLPPPRCLLPSPVAIPRRRLAFHRAASHRPVLEELVNSESKARFERECRQLADHLQRVNWLIDNPPLVTVPVPLSVHELMVDMLTLIESDRVTYYPLLPGVVDFGPPSGVPSGGSHSYATSTVGTPSHAGTNVDENFGSELMFSVATDEEPPTDMSDDAIGSELSESRPTTAIDHLLDTSGALADIENLDHLELSTRTAADPDVAMLSEDDTRDATTPEPANTHEFALVTNEDVQEELRPEDVPLLDSCRQNDDVRLMRVDEADAACARNSSDVNSAPKETDPSCERIRSSNEKNRQDHDKTDEPSGVHPSQSDEDDEDGSPDCVILDEEDFSDPPASPEIITADRLPPPCTDTLLEEDQPLDHRTAEEDELTPTCGRFSEASANLDYFKDEDEDDNEDHDRPKDSQIVSKNGDDKGVEGGDEAEDLEESLEIETTAGQLKAQRDSESSRNNDSKRFATPETERTMAGSGNLQVLPKEGEPSGESEHRCTPTHQLSLTEPTETSASASAAEDDDDVYDNVDRIASSTTRTENWPLSDDFANTPPTSTSIVPNDIVDVPLTEYQGLQNEFDLELHEDDHEVDAAEEDDEVESPSTSDATLSDEDTDIDTLLSAGGRAAVDDDVRNCETASDSTIEDDLANNDDEQCHHQQRTVHNQSNFPSDNCSTLPATAGRNDDGRNSGKQQTKSTHLGDVTASTCPTTAVKGERSTLGGASSHDEPDTSARPASFLSGGGLAPPPLPPRCRAQAAGGFSNRRRRRALSCRDLLIAVEQRKKAGQAANGSPCCLQGAQRMQSNGGETCGALHGDNNGCVCKLQPMLPCQKCGAFWHSDCIGPSRICSTCLLV